MPEARHSPRCSRLSTSDASGFLQSPAAPTAGVVGSERQLAVGAGGLQCLQSSRRHKVDSVFKGKRSMFPSSGPMQDFGVSLFDKQKRRTALWLETERQRIAKLPAPLRPLEIQRALVLYKEKLKELYGEDYVRREWSTLSKLTRAKLLEAE
ncbi:hypothetical protein BESB_063570 [Besnoitia besnoiti]|uniref:Uncharacterized protein n=1 Tax=Besnoitia besnoiti TaxID=94643 RepID=A0A2A9MJ98_BESBE|nr:hypothetical protein BESB_063570 [Besnoitia besnoiti]PFH35470.1 hypothetical protein BESB_063570 [Besnoitia besnoiti]